MWFKLRVGVFICLEKLGCSQNNHYCKGKSMPEDLLPAFALISVQKGGGGGGEAEGRHQLRRFVMLIKQQDETGKPGKTCLICPRCPDWPCDAHKGVWMCVGWRGVIASPGVAPLAPTPRVQPWSPEISSTGHQEAGLMPISETNLKHLGLQTVWGVGRLLCHGHKHSASSRQHQKALLWCRSCIFCRL